MLNDYFPSWPWYYWAVGYVVLRVLYTRVHEARLRKKFNALKPTNDNRDPTGGIITTLVLILARIRGKNPIEAMRFQFEHLPNPKVHTFKVLMYGKPSFITKDAENIKAVLATQFSDFDIGNRHGILLPLLGDGIFTLEGMHWKHLRATLRPQFARDQVGEVLLFERHSQKFLALVRKANGETIDINNMLYQFTIDVATEFLFGESIGALDDASGSLALVFNADFKDVQDMMLRRSQAQRFYWVWDSPLFRKKIRFLHDYAERYVEKALATLPEELEERSKDRYTFLYELVKVTRDRKMLRDQLFNILLAGRNTTLLFLTFFFYEMLRRPDLCDIVRTEVRGLYGEKDDPRLDEITFELLKQTKMLKACLDETLRLYPLVLTNFRAAIKDTTLPRGGGKDGTDPIVVEKGATVIFSTILNHRNQDFWGKDAEEFRPQRWFEDKFKRPGWNYMPFLGGPRICLGQQMALTEAAYLVTRLFQEFDNLESCNTEYPPKLIVHTTIKPSQGCKVKIW